ncbi:hypothetical protein GGR57DRAFT_494983 [Xylariaceae sp. FL1272]|nr:hypothetical protein GGR57DRAFT_494983 [Xylariaceae sp. FL1272]
MPPTASSQATQPPKPQRVLACAPCQQRKVKCDRRSPCANCVKSGASCVAASLAPRRRRFPERHLLDRLRKYEALLRQHHVPFEPLHQHTSSSIDDVGHAEGDEAYEEGHEQDDQSPAADGSSLSSSSMKGHTGSRDLWKAFYMLSTDHDDEDDGDAGYVAFEKVRDHVVKKTYDVLYDKSGHLILGARANPVRLAAFHPEPVQIFKLWQVYLDNVDPLLKVTHSPSLQSRIIEATGKIGNIDSPLEALMFSIYCVALLSLPTNECEAMFGATKQELLAKNHLACQEALINSGYMRTTDRDCLTALYLYLISAGQAADPRSISSMLSVAIRIGKRMGLHSELANASHPPHEAEMRRRLWWSIVLFDARLSELSDLTTTNLTPEWDCKLPSNVSDSALRVDIKELPPPDSKPTEALFSVVRCEIAQLVRNSAFHLDVTCPVMKALVKNRPAASNASQFLALEKTLQEKYLKFCDAENSLQFATVAIARALVAKYQLIEHYTKSPSPSTRLTVAERKAGVGYALSILEYDTKMMGSPLTKGYTWLAQFYFPMPAYAHLTQDLKRNPLDCEMGRIWEAMDENFEVRINIFFDGDANPLLEFFGSIVLEAWDACETAHRNVASPCTPPRIVVKLRERLARTAELQVDGEEPSVPDSIPPVDPSFMRLDDVAMSAQPLSFGQPNMGQPGNIPPWYNFLPPASAPIPFDPRWATMSWGLGGQRGW